MIVTLGTGHQIPLHWNDRFWEGNCPICKAEIWEHTPTDWAMSVAEHWEMAEH